MINGAHSIVYSKDPEADRAFLRDVLRLPSVEVGEGWLIFGLPPAEVAVHPSEENDVHELYLMCPDVEALVMAMRQRGLVCTPVQNRGSGPPHSRESARWGQARDLRAAPPTTESDEGA